MGGRLTKSQVGVGHSKATHGTLLITLPDKLARMGPEKRREVLYSLFLKLYFTIEMSVGGNSILGKVPIENGVESQTSNLFT